jgi:hypothetical protein
VITLTPVLGRWAADCPLWPAKQTDFYVGFRVADVAAGGDGDLDVDRTQRDRRRPVDHRDERREAIEKFLTCDDEDFAPVGLRIGDDDVVIDPRCCVGLDEWRDWLRVIGGEVIDLGHDPDPLVEHRGPVVRVWKNGGQLPAGSILDPDEPHIDIPRHALPQLLGAVQRISLVS